MGKLLFSVLILWAGVAQAPVQLGNTVNAANSIATTVIGSVGDGPIVNARVRVFSSSGQLLTTSFSSNTADFNFSFRTQGRHYPLILKADQGMDIVTQAPPDFQLVTTVLSPGNSQLANLNPYSTLIVLAAQKAGDLNSSNVSRLSEAVLQRYGFGLHSQFVPDPLYTEMDESNVHVFIKASETLGEMIRRTRDAMVVSGASVDGDAIVEALAADLVDGWIDGEGAPGTDPRISAVANVVTAAVMLESLSNRLYVYGVDATLAMDLAIQQVRPNAPLSLNTSQVPISREALTQTLRALRAVSVLSDDPRIAETYQIVANTEPGALGLPNLPLGLDVLLRGVVLQAAFVMDQALLQDINLAAYLEPPLDWPGEDSETGEDSESNEEEEGSDESDHGGSQPPVDEEEDESGSEEEPIEEEEEDLGDDADSGGGAEPAFGTALLSWTAPTERTDGSPVTDLAGFRVFFGKDKDSLVHIIQVNSPTQTSLLVEGLDVGKWYFAVTAFTTSGLESAKSQIVSKEFLD